ncbi:hypothetical protein ElyMa_001235900 [Elysia marginata]|uniref:Uncharacterized protein n=1 Tax=Elysia marginata TaxID=1093978 RepID=A0AAV4IAE7_9GAST|nr:hypothetical protein ElyMa_001235900 [Elysia marginata]
MLLSARTLATHLMLRRSMQRIFSHTISLKKTNIMSQHVDNTPTMMIDEQILESVDKSTYLGSTISTNVSLDAELNVRIYTERQKKRNMTFLVFALMHA